MQHMFRRKSLDQLVREAGAPHWQLRRTLGPISLMALGIGAIIGAGIFSAVGTAAAGGPDHLGAGPALILSFVLVAVVCGLSALCYAELASMVPVAGSAYTYAYATLGELAAWIIGWDLILEYAVGNVGVAISWSGYFQEVLRVIGLDLPAWLCTDYRSAAAAVLAAAPHVLGLPVVFNLPAVLIVLLVTWVLVIGIRESAWVNTLMVVLKLAIITFFIVMGLFYVKPQNWQPFMPNGFAGVSQAAAIIFFAYIGFDAVSTAAEETRNPQRDLPIGMIGSLLVCTVIYILVAVVLTGLLPYKQLNTAEPLATAFSAQGLSWTAAVISLGAVLATTSVLVVFQIGQPRIFFSMARDGLLPAWAARVHGRYRTPHVTTILTGLLVAVFAGVANIQEVVVLTNIGTLFAFMLVAAGVIILRVTDPDRPRPFRTPLSPWVPLGSIATCAYLMIQLPWVTWFRFLLWLAAGLVIYLLYGARHSRLKLER
jgi:APA family basic amino acid/polyamine antiporter